MVGTAPSSLSADVCHASSNNSHICAQYLHRQASSVGPATFPGSVPETCVCGTGTGVTGGLGNAGGMVGLDHLGRIFQPVIL